MKHFFTTKDEWSDNYSTMWVEGATAEQIIEVAKALDPNGEHFFNGEADENGLISFEVSTWDHRALCDELSAQVEDAVFYSFLSQDENDLYASKDGSQFSDYIIRTDEAPYIDDPSCLEDYEEDDFCELQYENIFSWEFTVLNKGRTELFSVGAGDFALQEIDNIWNKQ